MSPATTNGDTSKLDWTVFHNIIDGKLSTASITRHSVNPATLEANPEVPVATKDDVERAMAAAKAVTRTWAATPWGDRKKALLAFADALEGEKEPFSKMLTQEQGKPVRRLPTTFVSFCCCLGAHNHPARQIMFARMELDFALHWIRTIAELELPVEKLESGDKTIVVRYTPLGVAVGIVPWNYPVLLAVGKIAPAVLTGNPIIIKPSPFTPATGIKLCELAQQFFPPGVIQCLSGDDSLGPWLTSHPVPAKISFTGSTFTGKKIMESCSRTLKRVTLELGGKDPAIVLDDVDIPEVASKVATLAFLNSGQICIALKRIYVDEKIIDQFRDEMVKFTKTLQMGEGNQDGVFLGPIQNSMQYEKVKGFFDDIDKEHWTVAVGGKIPNTGKGYFITPTIIDRPEEKSRIVTEEPFGEFFFLFRVCRGKASRLIFLLFSLSFQAPSSLYCRSAPTKKRSKRPTTPCTVSEPRSGPATSPERIEWPSGSRLEACG